ncbi:MAG: efflux RND transporter periplasmic adaptor subunit [bacterium]|nr:efflux RND transporter periplasmic adaptor subunit [bacterium]
MKIDWKSKQTRVVAILLAVIIIPIIYNQAKGIITGVMTSYMMSQPPEVEVAYPVEKDINATLKTTGRIEAKYSVDIIARVEGWLQERYFEEGASVKKGQKLFKIQPEEYSLAARNARASVNEASAVYHNSQVDYQRAAALLKEDLVSREYYDNALANRNRTRAALDGAKAQLSKANLDLSYTNIVSPMNGRIGKVMISEGNYVTPSTGVLTQVYSTNPMKVTFSLKSSDFIKVKKYFVKNGQYKLPNKHLLDVILNLADGSTYDKTGKIEFIDNKIDPTTGTVTIRAIFENPHELLVHGDYVNVILRETVPTKVMLVPQSATKTDVGTGYYVWVIDKDGKTEKRDIKVHYNLDNNWVVEGGLEYTDKIIVNGVQNIYKSGQKVKIKNKIEDKKENK